MYPPCRVQHRLLDYIRGMRDDALHCSKIGIHESYRDNERTVPSDGSTRQDKHAPQSSLGDNDRRLTTDD